MCIISQAVCSSLTADQEAGGMPWFPISDEHGCFRAFWQCSLCYVWVICGNVKIPCRIENYFSYINFYNRKNSGYIQHKRRPCGMQITNITEWVTVKGLWWTFLYCCQKGTKKEAAVWQLHNRFSYALLHFIYSNSLFIFLMFFCPAPVNIVKEMVSPFLLFSTLSFIFFKFSCIFILCFSGLWVLYLFH